MAKRVVCLIIVFVIAVSLFPATGLARDELKNEDPSRFYLVLDLKNQCLYVYEKDELGEYTKLVRRMIVSTGKMKPSNPEDPEDVGTPTPTGIWKIGGRERFGKFAEFGGEYARYWTQLVVGNYFHSIMFGKRDINALKSGAFGRLGNAVSHGCIRMYIEDAKWLYYYACPGTTCEVTNSLERDSSITKALKTDMPFKEYNELQKTFYDEPELENYRAWVVVDEANVRKGHGTHEGVSFRLKKGDEVEILQVGNPWCKVKNLENEKEGYIFLANITFEKGTTHSTENAVMMKATNWMYKVPSGKREDRICKVPTDTAVTVYEKADGWTKIGYWGETGWVKDSWMYTGWGVDVTKDIPVN